jgi:hypothetical protein
MQQGLVEAGLELVGDNQEPILGALEGPGGLASGSFIRIPL